MFTDGILRNGSVQITRKAIRTLFVSIVLQYHSVTPFVRFLSLRSHVFMQNFNLI